MKKSVVWVGMIAIALSLSACGGSDDDTSGGGGTATTAQSQSAAYQLGLFSQQIMSNMFVALSQQPSSQVVKSAGDVTCNYGSTSITCTYECMDGGEITLSTDNMDGDWMDGWTWSFHADECEEDTATLDGSFNITFLINTNAYESGSMVAKGTRTSVEKSEDSCYDVDDFLDWCEDTSDTCTSSSPNFFFSITFNYGPEDFTAQEAGCAVLTAPSGSAIAWNYCADELEPTDDSFTIWFSMLTTGAPFGVTDDFSKICTMDMSS